MTTAVKERPILFTEPMVRAIVAGQKTQTRRLVNPKYSWDVDDSEGANKVYYPCYVTGEPEAMEVPCPYGDVGDWLYVRETWSVVPHVTEDGPKNKAKGDGTGVTWRAAWDGNPSGFKWKPSIHMPRWASRIKLEIVRVGVERLQDISEADAYAEGVTIPDNYKFASNGRPEDRNEARVTYEALWESINGAGSWAQNPWVWVIEFKKLSP
jgi:hypothetical protein